MNASFERLYQDIRAWAETQGIFVGEQQLDAKKAGVFNGVSATMNSDYSAEERSYYLIHALGSMVRWSLSQPAVQAMFNELRDAKKDREADRDRLERAIEQYRTFEIESSEFAVWLLAELGHADVTPSYTNFMRADLESLTQYHRTGQAPVWRDFFAGWNDEVAHGRRQVASFTAKPIPPFLPVQVEKQEILQKQSHDP